MKMPFTLDAPEAGLAVLNETGVPPLSREEMLKQFRAGQRGSVTFAATTYIHGPNRNHTRLNTDELETFAASFKGQPFLMDHSRSQADRGGTIIASELVEADGKKAIRQTVKAVKPWAVEGVLDGTVDRFSIGWNANRYDCTVCEKPFFKCGHDVNDLGELDEKSGKPVEVLMKGLEGMEVSAVTHPAVPGTGVLDALQQLKEATLSGETSREQNKEAKMKEKVLELLGLGADTADPEALTVLEQRLKAPKEVIPASMLAVLELKPEATTDDAIAAVVTLKAPGNFVPRAEHDKALADMGAIVAQGKIEKGLAAGKITPAGKAWALQFATDHPEAFDAWIASKQVEVPNLPGTVVQPTTATAKTEPEISELGEHIRERMGVTRDEYLATLKAAELAN